MPKESPPLNDRRNLLLLRFPHAEAEAEVGAAKEKPASTPEVLANAVAKLPLNMRFTRRAFGQGSALLATTALASGLFVPDTALVKPDIVSVLKPGTVIRPNAEIVDAISKHHALGNWLGTTKQASDSLLEVGSVDKIAAAQSLKEAELVESAVEKASEEGLQIAAKTSSVKQALATNAQRLNALLGNGISSENRMLLQRLSVPPSASSLAAEEALEEMKLRALRNEGRHQYRSKLPKRPEQATKSDGQKAPENVSEPVNLPPEREHYLSDDTLVAIEAMKRRGPANRSLLGQVMEERLAKISDSVTKDAAARRGRT